MGSQINNLKNAFYQELAKKYRKVYLCLPTYRTIPTVCYQHMIAFMCEMQNKGFQLGILMTDHTTAVAARNEIAKQAYLRGVKYDNADIFVWIDSDHTFSFSDFMTLLRHYDENPDIHILSARNLTKNLAAPRICAYTELKNIKNYKTVDPSVKKVMEVDAVGFGFVMVSPEVITKMYEVYDRKQFMVEFSDLTKTGIKSEDISWCELAREQGYKIWLDNHVTPGHYGAIMSDEFFQITIKNKDQDDDEDDGQL